MRKIGIYINKKKVDTINAGESKTFEVPIGRNEIYAKIDWCKTKPLEFDMRGNELKNFIVGSNIRGWRFLIAIYYATIRTSKYLFIKETY